MFDQAALTYDQDFTHSNIGILLRNHVWSYLDKVIETKTPLNILELNCGTGEDALRFAQHGHNVIATDQSEEMVRITREKIKKKNLLDKVQSFVCDLKEIKNCKFESKFDLVFSNFGGLNCLNHIELEKLSNDLFQLLKPNGRFIAIVMPRFCVWESLYFLLKFDTQKAFRRNTPNSLQVKVGAEMVETWYYSPSDFKRIFEGLFIKLASKPMGIALPPSYMESSIGQKSKWMDFLNQTENILGSITSLAAVSDHFLMDLQRRAKI